MSARAALRRTWVLVLAVVVVTVAAGVGLGLWATGGDGDGGGPAGASQDTAAGPSPTPTPSPTRWYPLSKAPRTIPAVRSHTPARGPGWKPEKGLRVVVSDGDLADEGRLLAGELGMSYAGETADVRAGDVRLALSGDEGADPESYTMTVRGGRVTISGPADAGVFYGTRTLKQEVRRGGAAPEGVVRDEPAKPVRGLMVDIARKHFTAAWIEDRVRELGDLKFNQLGLHFSDDQGFRIESDSHPEVVSRDRLTKAQVRRIVALAAQRHITVVPEIDSPGHLGAVIDAHPELQLRSAAGLAPQGAIDISKPASAEIVDDLLKEYAELFPGAEWHLGGDEYRALMVSNPAATYPQLATAAREAYGSGATVSDLTTGWLNDRAATVRALGRTPRAWNDGFFRGTSVRPADDLRVAYWTGKEIGARPPAEYLGAGRKLVNYNDEFLYYVLGQPLTFVYPTGQRIYERWTPLVVRGTQAVPSKYDDQILGGSFAVWGDLPNSQTQAQVAAGIRMPLRATVQKLWDPREPALSWTEFRALADRLG
ncbi:beta-N-acetylglucosaminidase [Streptomyces lincolnensis]|uniref:Beta-N-acetylglucosaminidase n=1 Tax=Streptomyces lincolnensis TaxID=1915 RepID=A0A1B1MG27_STRLN|nr:glycoside hydrolase family 20 protein [Streptomyces lincolnensis]ANS67467.1 beta-N-acetylglucosaminidase [Streptomyces lincolnensis]AXG54782.1 beta-N-acetylglucosaminidase [Streptomyces lincolnensis]QMV09136.1 family 20 glycosylhydrolase [Streptomyces lincolnensis]